MKFHGQVASRWWYGSATLIVACAGRSSQVPVAPAAVDGMPAARRVVRPGIDVLLTDSIALVRGRRVGFVANVNAVDRNGRSAIERLRESGVELVALFGPEHGLEANAAPGEKVASSVYRDTRIPIYSLYGSTRAPTTAMLQGIDVMLVDLPDVGARYYTWLATTVDVMQAAGAHKIPVIVLDRPNPINGVIEGNVLDPAFSSAVGRLAVPMRHGLTLGEHALLARADLALDVDLRVVPAEGWTRDMPFDATGLPFLAPSPNLRDLDALFHYPGTCLFEGTALSVGRGSEAPFHQVGAPWLDTTAVLARMRSGALAGVAFHGVRFTPLRSGDAKFDGTSLLGVRLEITDRSRYDPVRTAIHLLAAIQAVHPTQIRIGGSFDRLAGGTALRTALVRGDAPDVIVATWEADLAAYRSRITPYLLYR